MSGNISRKARLKKQTRLTFDPVDLTSSPDVPLSVFSPARVVYKSHLSPSLLRSSQRISQRSPIRGANTQVMRGSSSKKDSQISFPASQATPSKKSTKKVGAKKLKGNSSDSGSDSSDDTDTKEATRKNLYKSSQIHSSAVRNSSPRATSSPNFMARNKRSIQHDASSSPPPPAHPAHSATSDDDTTSTDELAAPRSAVKREFSIEIPLRRHDSFARKTASKSNNDHPPSQSSSQKPIELVSEDDDDDIKLPTPLRIQPIVPVEHIDADSDSEEVVAPPLRSSQRQTQQKILSDEDDEDDVVLPTPAKRKRPAVGDGETNGASSPAKRLRTRKAMNDSSESEDLPIRPTASAKKNGKTKAEPASSQRTTRQQVVKRHRTEREKKMELLRRRREGEKNLTQLTDSGSDSDAPRQGIYDSNSELEVLSHFDDEEEQAQAMESVRQSIRGANRNTYEEDFIVEDDENEPIGAPGMGLHDIPLEFTRQAHKPLKEHFKDCIEWMVQKKINPGFNSNDPLYRNSFLKVSDEVRGLANSKFMSSIWKPDFALALQARPIFNETELITGESSLHMHCDACNRNHPTRYILQFTGEPYNIDTLEPLERDEDDEDEEDDVDTQGRVIPKAEKIWYVGRFCKANAETSHSLLHWKYALNLWVVDQLINEKYMKSRKLAEREKWSMKKRGDEANRIVDSWEAGKQIKELYRDFKVNLDSARNSVQSRTKTSRE